MFKLELPKSGLKPPTEPVHVRQCTCPLVVGVADATLTKNHVCGRCGGVIARAS